MDAEIIGIFGLQGWGKTALTTAFGKIAYDKGYKIYSNYHLNFDYTPVTTLKEAQAVRNGYLLLDELWQWVHARTSQSKINKEMMAICLLNRKRGINIVYNTQLPRTIDVILRDVTAMRVLPQMRTAKDGNTYVYYMGKDLLGRETNWKCINIPIHVLGNMFNTREEIGKLDEPKTLLEIGIEYEKKCASAINKIKNYKARLNPDSGKDTGFKKIDLWIRNDLNIYGANVKSTTKTHVTICDNEHIIKDEMNKFLKDAKEWHYKPLILFPVRGKNGNSLNYPSAWYVYELDNNSYLLDSKSHQARYEKLSNASTILKKWAKP